MIVASTAEEDSKHEGVDFSCLPGKNVSHRLTSTDRTGMMNNATEPGQRSYEPCTTDRGFVGTAPESIDRSAEVDMP